MSTILRALKKAEQASMDRHSVIDDSVGFKFRGRGDDQPVQRLQFRKGPGLIVAAGVGLVLAVVVIYVFWPGNMFSLPGKALAPVAKKDDKGPSGAGAAKLVLPEEELSAAPVLSHQPFDIETLPAPVAKKTTPVNSRPAKRISDKNSHEKTAPAKADTASLAENVYIQTLEPENLKLQAISWAVTPSARVTVINDRVLGEKDTIEGYEIVTINKNEIILSDGSSEKFRLAFKNR